ncbi:MAG: formyltransferase family protein [Thermomicrobiales bacterium]
MSLRIVTCNVMVMAYELVAGWAERAGHEIVLLVTSPAGTVERYGASYLALVEVVAPRHPVLVTASMKAAAPQIAAARPDLLLSATFPHKLPASVTAIPRLGAFNMHPTPLPQGRGPNPLRPLYDGAETLGFTLHQTSPVLDGGLIYSRQEAPLPDDLSHEAIFGVWGPLAAKALDEGIARALAGEPGLPQDETRASYGAPFTEAEHWLDWDTPLALLRKRVAALQAGSRGAFAILEEQPIRILRLIGAPAADPLPDVPPGTVTRQTHDTARVRVQDGLADVTFAFHEGDPPQ